MSIVASHPASMKDPILEHATKIFNLLLKIKQKREAQSKLDSLSDNVQSYIPGLIRTSNPVVAPNYLEDSKRIGSIVQEAHELNDMKKAGSFSNHSMHE